MNINNPTTFGTPSLTYSTSNSSGSGGALRADDTIAVFDATVPTTIAYSASAAAGSSGTAARRSHVHGMVAAPATFDSTDPTTIAYADDPAPGSSGIPSQRDHTHGMVAAPAAAASAAEMEAASSTTVWVTPGRTQNHPGVSKAWVKITGGDGATEKSYNTTSTARNGTGDYTWTLATDLSATDYVAISGCEGDADRTATDSIISGTRIDIFTRAAGTLTDLSSHNMCLGDQ